MYYRKTRWTAFLLLIALCVSLLTVPALAASEPETTTQQTDAIEVQEPEEATVYVVPTQEELADTTASLDNETPESDSPVAEDPLPTESAEAEEVPQTPAEDPMEEPVQETETVQESASASEEPLALDGTGEVTVTYYVGTEVLQEEKVSSGACPAEVPGADAEGKTITGWLNADGSFVVVSKTAVTADTAYYAWYAPSLVSEHTRYINGTGNAKFNPDGNLTRAQAATLLYNLLVSKEKGPYSVSFSDISSDKWYAEAVNTLASYKIINGYSDGTFRPNSSMTRAEFVTMLVRMVGVQGGSVSFKDTIPDWAADYIATAVNLGWINGYEDNTFRSSKPVTRAQAVKIINRMLERTPDKTTISAKDDFRIYADVANTSSWYYYEVLEASVGHSYSAASSGESWTKYTVESCGLSAGLNKINSSCYYYVDSSQQLVRVNKGITKIGGGCYLSLTGGYAIYGDLASKTGYVTYASGGQAALTNGFNLLGGDNGLYVYWDSSQKALRSFTPGVNSINGTGYYIDSDGYTIRRDFGAGVVQIDGKYYLSTGKCDIVISALNTLTDSGSSGEVYDSTNKYVKTVAETIDLKNHTYEYNGAMYYIQSDYSLAIDQWQGYLYFGTDGKYTTGDSTLDAYVTEVLGSITSNSALSQRQKLLKAYYLIRGGEGAKAGTAMFSYRQTGEGYTRTRYNAKQQYSWIVTLAKRMFSTKSGMCYDWAAAYLYVARRLGFQSYIVVGNYGRDYSQNTDARHCWCMIQWDNKWHISDVEVEWGYLNKWYVSTSTYQNLFDQTVTSEYISSYTNSERSEIKYFFKNEA
jgi:hypothetical protein